jgi:uncharacterized protein YecE (DUF72 family)
MVASKLKLHKAVANLNRSEPTVRIGTAGWSIPKQFTAELPYAGTHLERYSRAFNCAEVNSSFYRPHTISTWAKWAASTPEDFSFSVKAPKAITHEAGLACPAAQLKTFLEGVKTLAEKLGPILFQLPLKLAFNPTIAATFVTMLRDLHSGPTVFEPRHPTWFTAEADHLLQRFRIARVAADPARTPEASTPSGWSSLIYYRLHGSPRMYYSAYTEAFLQSLAATVAHQQQTAEVWCLFDNTASGAALGDAAILKRLLAALS